MLITKIIKIIVIKSNYLFLRTSKVDNVYYSLLANELFDSFEIDSQLFINYLLSSLVSIVNSEFLIFF